MAGAAVAALPEKWLADMPSRDAQCGDRAASGQAAAYETCIDELEAALAQDRASQAGAGNAQAPGR